jgi:hypothetical protein
MAVIIPMRVVMTLSRRLLGVIAAIVMCSLARIPRICWRSVLVVIEHKVIVVSCRLLCVGLIRLKVVGGLAGIALMMCSRLPGS